MGVTIVRKQAVYHLIAEHDLYLDADKTKVLVVKDGEEVPTEAAFILAGKGSGIPPMYIDLLEAMETLEPEVVDEVETPQPLPQAPVEPEPAQVKSKARKQSSG